MLLIIWASHTVSPVNMTIRMCTKSVHGNDSESILCTHTHTHTHRTRVLLLNTICRHSQHDFTPIPCTRGCTSHISLPYSSLNTSPLPSTQMQWQLTHGFLLLSHFSHLTLVHKSTQTNRMGTYSVLSLSNSWYHVCSYLMSLTSRWREIWEFKISHMPQFFFWQSQAHCQQV